MKRPLSIPKFFHMKNAFGHILSRGKIGFFRGAVEETYVNRNGGKTPVFHPVEKPVDSVENSYLSTEKTFCEDGFPQGERGTKGGKELAKSADGA